MFTGIISHVGVIATRTTGAGRTRFEIEAPGLMGRLRPGDSVAVNGTCLTATEVGETGFAVDAVETTLSRTTLGSLTPCMEVNLEYALAAGEPLGGHIVQGHVDEVGIVTEVTPIGDMHRLTVQLGDATRRVTVERGSLAIDGVSLTVAALAGDIAEFAIIPYTWSRTTLRHLERGSHVNVEADLIGKYVDRLIEPYRAQGAVSPELSALADSQNDTDRLSDD